MTVVEDIIKIVVARSNRQSGIETKFQFGPPKEIVSNLNQLTKSGASKYPVIALLEPYKQEISVKYRKATLHFLIATVTSKTIKSDERLNTNYRNILFPVCDSFIKELALASMMNISYEQYNRFDMGGESIKGYDGDILNDHVDSIELYRVIFHPKNCYHWKIE